jgi:hypothetical protein
MSYTVRSGRRYYWVDDNVLANHSDEVSTTNNFDTWTKSIVLFVPIQIWSRFRYKVDIRSSVAGQTTTALLYRGVLGGGSSVEMTFPTTTSATYVTVSDDTALTGWAVGDRLELWLHGNGANTAYAKNFKICGVGSEWAL